MTPSRPKLRSALALAAVSLFTTNEAFAFCRKTTSSPGDPSYDPSTTGTCGDARGKLPLFWPRSCIEYRVIVSQTLLSRGTISKADARELVKQATDSWTEAPCDQAKGGQTSPRIRLLDLDDGERCDGSSGASGDTTANTIWISHDGPGPEDGSAEGGGSTLARTFIVYDSKSGAINSAQIKAFNVSDLSSTAGSKFRGLLTTRIRHEMGHFLGLAHSENENAIMYFSENSSQGSGDGGRPLNADDENGICAIYSPNAPLGEGCSAAPVDGPPSLNASVLAGAFAWIGSVTLRRSRRGRRPPSKSQ